MRKKTKKNRIGEAERKQRQFDRELKDCMNTKYDVLDQKSRELSEAAREIENYLSQEQSRDRQKKKNRSVLE